MALNETLDLTYAKYLHEAASKGDSKGMEVAIKQVLDSIQVGLEDYYWMVMAAVKRYNVEITAIKADWTDIKARIRASNKNSNEQRKARYSMSLTVAFGERVEHYGWPLLCREALEILHKIVEKLSDWETFVELLNQVLFDRFCRSISGSAPKIDKGLKLEDIRVMRDIQNKKLARKVPTIAELERWTKPCSCVAGEERIQKFYGVRLDQYGLLVSSGERMVLRSKPCCRTRRIASADVTSKSVGMTRAEPDAKISRVRKRVTPYHSAIEVRPQRRSKSRGSIRRGLTRYVRASSGDTRSEASTDLVELESEHPTEQSSDADDDNDQEMTDSSNIGNGSAESEALSDEEETTDDSVQTARSSTHLDPSVATAPASCQAGPQGLPSMTIRPSTVVNVEQGDKNEKHGHPCLSVPLLTAVGKSQQSLAISSTASARPPSDCRAQSLPPSLNGPISSLNALSENTQTIEPAHWRSWPTQTATCADCNGPCKVAIYDTSNPTWDVDALHEYAHCVQAANKEYKGHYSLLTQSQVHFATCARVDEAGNLPPGAHVRLMNLSEAAKITDLKTPVLIRAADNRAICVDKDAFLHELEQASDLKKLEVRIGSDRKPKNVPMAEFVRAMRTSEPLMTRRNQRATTPQDRVSTISYNALRLRRHIGTPEPDFLQKQFRHLSQLRDRAVKRCKRMKTAEKRALLDALDHDFSQSFDIAATTGAFSGFHVDVLANTWLASQFGKKLFWLAVDPDEADWRAFRQHNDHWTGTEGKVVVVPMTPGDILINANPHAVLTLEPAAMTGGMFWHRDPEWMQDTLTSMLRIVEHHDLSNESFHSGMASVLEVLEKDKSEHGHIRKAAKVLIDANKKKVWPP